MQMTTPDLNTLTLTGEEAISEISDSTEVKCRLLTPIEVNVNWEALAVVIKDVADVNATMSKLFSRDAYVIIAEKNDKIGAAVLITIGKHGASEGFNTCFIDGFAIADRENARELITELCEFVCDFASSSGCVWIVGDTQNAKLAKVAEQLNFRSVKMYKLIRKVG